MNSETLLLYKETEDVTELHTSAVKDIFNGKLTILELVEGLSSHLTSVDEERRRQGVCLLANVIKSLPINHFNEKEVDVLKEFFCDRLKDRLTIIPATLMGLESISLMENLSDKVPSEIMSALPLNLTAQTLTQSSRLTYYAILKNLIFKKSEVLLKNPTNLVYSVVSAIDSESDPRCLIFLFQFLPHVFRCFPLEHLVEEVFSVLECYFPIDFNPREQNNITREDLAKGLQECLLATPAFAPFIIPTIMDKLESQLKIAHLDSLNLLINGLEIWELIDFKPHSVDIWKSLSKLILPPTDNEVRQLAVNAIISLITKLNDSSAYHQLDQLLDNISASTRFFLVDPSLNLFLPTAKLLAAVSQVCERSCEYIIKTVLGQLIAVLGTSSRRDIILSTLTPILNASVKFNCWTNGTNDIRKLLDQIPEKLIDALSDTKARSGCFSCLIEIASHLSLEQRQKIIDIILAAINQELSPGESEMCAAFLQLIGTKYPEELKNNLLIKLNVKGDTLETKKHLDVFCWCCNVSQLTCYSIDKILHHIISTESSTIAIECLRELCIKTDEKVLIMFGTECKVPERLLTFALQHNDLKEESVIHISKIMQNILRTLNSSQQKSLINDCLMEFMSPDSRNFLCLSNKQLFLLEGLICPLRSEVPINMCESLVTSLIDSSITNESYSARESASIILASIINKYQNDEMPINVILNATENVKQKETILLLSWTAKSLIMRGHSQANLFIDKLISSLRIQCIQMEAAEGFKLILVDHDNLSLNNYCIIKLLYKQRIFLKLNDLISLLDKAENEQKTAILLAISYILQYVPKSLVMSKLSEIIPIMVQGLDCDSLVVISAVLDLTASLLESGEQIFEKYIDTFIPRCLRCVHTSKSMDVRIQALNCIYYYGKFKEISILAHRDSVLSGLEKSLDDKKRLVRLKAVRARNRWFFVGGLASRQ